MDCDAIDKVQSLYANEVQEVREELENTVAANTTRKREQLDTRVYICIMLQMLGGRDFMLSTETTLDLAKQATRQLYFLRKSLSENRNDLTDFDDIMLRILKVV